MSKPSKNKFKRFHQLMNTIDASYLYKGFQNCICKKKNFVDDVNEDGELHISFTYPRSYLRSMQEVCHHGHR